MNKPIEIPNEIWNNFIESVAAYNGLKTWRVGGETGVVAFAMFASFEERPPTLVANVPPDIIGQLMWFHLNQPDDAVTATHEPARGSN